MAKYVGQFFPSIVFLLVSVSCASQRVEQSVPIPIAASSTPTTTNSSRLNAKEVMRKVAERYHRLRSYRSVGNSVYTLNIYGRETTNEEISFEIRRGGSDDYSIVWEQNHRRKMLKSEKGNTWLEVEGERSEKFPTPREGFSAAAGAEGGWSVFLISPFVFHEEILPSGNHFAEVVNPSVSGEDELDGHRCYLLTGTFNGVDGETVYWIDADDWLIRRIERKIYPRSESAGGARVGEAHTVETYTDIKTS